MSGFARAAVLLLSLSGLCAWSGEAEAIAKFARIAGNWGTAGTWSSVSCATAGATTVPTAADDVTICPGIAVVMNGNPGRALSLVINGTANWTQARTTNVGTGGVTINAGGDIAGTVNGVLTSTGGLTINAALTSTTVTITLQTTAAQTINGTGSLARFTVTGAGVTATNIGTLTVGTALAGTGGLTNSATGILNIGGTSLITGLDAATAGNVVNYTGGAAQTVKATTYDTLNFSGAGVKTNTGVVTVNTALTGTALTNAATGTLNIGGTSTITTLTATAAGNIVNYTGVAQTIKPTSYATLNVTGTATNSGTVTAAAALGGTGALTNASTGILNIGGTSLITTLNAATAGNIVNYTGAGQTIKPTSYATLNVTGTATNSGTVTVATALGGGGTLTNAAAGTLNIGGTSTITTLTATSAGNTVNYTGAAQTVNATTYHHLGLGGSGAKAIGATTINGNFTMSDTATTAPTGALTVGGNFSIGATNTFANGANALNVAGNFAQDGTFTAGAGVVTLNGGAAVQTISGTGPLGFANLTVSNAGITLARNVTVTSAIIGTVTLTSTCPTDYTLTSNGGATVAHSCTASVVSINRADADPTSAASVSWAVTFNRSVSGVSSGNFVLANAGLGGTPAITLVSGGGNTWAVTASTGSGDGTLGLNMVNSTGVSPAITGLPFTGQVYTLDRIAPAVSSIVRASPNPTSQASVSWTATFSESVTGVDMADFALVPTGGVSGALITAMTPVSGTVYTVTASTGVGQGTLGLNLVDDDTIVDIVNNPLGGTGAGNGNFSGEFYDIVSTAPIVYANPTACTNVAGIGTIPWNTVTPNDPLASDNFYATASVDGTTTNFLQCTGYGFAIPLGATINGITVNVERNSNSAANGGSQDAAMRIVKAGVIGATDRSTATIYPTADTPMAYGGAADLWGATWTAADINYANFGAAFAATKANGAGQPHTISVDHIQIGISYTALPDHYELHLPTSGITCLPATVTVKACADSLCATPYTAASGTSVNLGANAGALGSTTVTFNASGVASTTLSYPAAVDGATASVTLSGEQITATNPRKCCPDGTSCAVANSCSATFNTAGFILSDQLDGATVAVLTQVAGQSSVPYYLRAVKTNTTTKACETALAGANTVNFAYECNNPATCSASNLMSVNGGTATTIARNNNGSVTGYTPVSMTFDANGNAPFTLNYSDVGQVTLHASKAAGGTLLSALIGSSNAFVVKPGGFVLSNIAPTLNPTGRCAVNPDSAPPCATDAAGTRFVRAGEAFSATVAATTCSPASATCTVASAATPNYGKETPAEGVRFVDASLPSTDPNYANHGTLAAGLGLTNNPAIGGTFGAFTNGVATGTAFTWNEVGIITLTPSVADADYLGTGDVTGTTSGNVGRFYAAQFALSGGVIANRTGLGGVCAVAGCDTFTYMGEQLSAMFTLTAQAVGGAQLQNYNWSATPANQFAMLNPMAAVVSGTGGPLGMGAVDSAATRTPFLPCGVAPAHPCLTPAQATAGAFASGVANVTVPLTFYRGNAAVGPYASLDIGVAPVDSDGAALTYNLDTVNLVAGTPNHTLVGQTRARYGRMKLSNAHGSELLKLAVPMEAQFWQGQYWAQNSLDDTTAIALGNIKSSDAAVTISGVSKDAAGRWHIVLNKPMTPASANICLDLDTGATGDTSCQAATPLSIPYLQTGAAFDKDPVSRATFGVYKGNNEFIYLREAY